MLREDKIIENLKLKGVHYLYSIIENKEMKVVFDITLMVKDWRVYDVDRFCFDIYLMHPLLTKSVKWFGVNERIYMEIIYYVPSFVGMEK